MSFTMIALQAKFTNADGSPASGTLCARPNSRLENLAPGESPQTTEPICGLLDPQGRLVSQAYTAFEVAATDDPNTTPIGSSYTFSLKLDGQNLVEFSSGVPASPSSWSGSYPVICYDNDAATVLDSAVVQLVDLIASESMIGATITGPGIDGPQTITSVDVANNRVTMGSPAIASDASVAIEGGCLPFTSLQANAL